ncbi:hypothetical protein CEXT_148001 [Caerostris extrusa]|uniref:Uncharacterized protein n=1 Tax=Caerostris extrusa TaxID=172846 RepID=A0AAV4S6I4_CAEEX|nr:hypothetical protein CEXT_148001 [Caerostris extrusa]
MQRNICLIILLFLQDVKSQLTQTQLIQNFDQATACTPRQALPWGPVTAISPQVLIQYYALMKDSMRLPKCLMHRAQLQFNVFNEETYSMCVFGSCRGGVSGMFLYNEGLSQKYRPPPPGVQGSQTKVVQLEIRPLSGGQHQGAAGGARGYGAPGAGQRGSARGGYPGQQPGQSGRGKGSAGGSGSKKKETRIYRR